MIGAASIARLFGRGVTSAPAAGPAPRAERSFALAVTELRCALALFDVADELDRLQRDDGYVLTEGESMAYAYAGWTLARAAQRLAGAHAAEADAGVPS